MNKIEYDSLHKFFVSIGITFIILPFAIILYFFKTDIPIITKEDIVQLSDYSLNLIDFHNKILNLINNRLIISIIIVFMILMISFGVFFIALGIRGWKKVQKEYDKIVENDRKEKDLLLKKMTVEEVVEKTIKEVDETEDCHHNNQNNHNKINDNISHPYLRYLEMENAYFSKYIDDEFRKKYVFSRNVKINRCSYDAIAVSILDNIDILYEIKYYTRPLSTYQLEELIRRFVYSGINYENSRHRNFICQLIIISNERNICVTKNNIEKLKSELEHINGISRLKIEYIEENQLVSN